MNPTRRVLHTIPIHTPPVGRAVSLELSEESNDQRTGVLSVSLVQEGRDGMKPYYMAVPSFAVDDLLAAVSEMRKRIVERQGPNATQSRPLARRPERAPVPFSGERPRFERDDGGAR